jgi:thiol:disulfide interchange protein DsbD
LEFDEDCKVLVLSASIDEGWHIYSQHQNEKAGPIPTDISVEMIGSQLHEAAEPQPIKSFDENYGGEVLYFEDNVDFRFAIPVEYEGVINVKVVFMTCNEEGCLPPELKEFKISI